MDLQPIDGVSEARELHVARLIYESSDWVLAKRNGLIPSKPPLYHWCAAALAHWAGNFELAGARLPSVLFGAGTILLTMLLSLRLSACGRNSRVDGALLALLSALILCSTFGFVLMMGLARVDMSFTFFVTLALYFLLRHFAIDYLSVGPTSNLLRLRDLNLFFLACAFGVLARGPLGLVLPVLIGFVCLGYLLGAKQAALTFLRPCWGWLAFIALTVSWYAAAAKQGGDSFLGKQIVFENIQRFLGGDKINTQPFWFYLPAFLRAAFPWSLLFVFFSFNYFRGNLRPSENGGLGFEKRVQGIGAMWFVAGFVFLSLASGKRSSYLLPLYPGLSIFVAWKLHDLLLAFNSREQHYFSGWLSRINAFPFLLVLVLLLEIVKLPLFMWDPVWLELRWWLVPQIRTVQLVLLGAWALSQIFSRIVVTQTSSLYFSLLCALTISVSTLFTSGLVFGAAVKNRLKGWEQMGLELKAVSAGQDLHVIADEREEIFDVVLYHLGREVTRINPKLNELECTPDRLFLSRESWFKDFENFALAQKIKVEIKARLNQTLDQKRGRSHRAMVLFTCSK